MLDKYLHAYGIPRGSVRQTLQWLAHDIIPLAAVAGTLPKRGERWKATRIVPGANYRTFMLVFTVATSLVEMNSTARLSPPAFILAQSAAKTARSISSFATEIPLRPVQTIPLQDVQQGRELPWCGGCCTLTSLRPAARTNSLVNRS